MYQGASASDPQVLAKAATEGLTLITAALGQLAPVQAETQAPHVINLADHQVRPRPILGGLTSEYQIAT